MKEIPTKLTDIGLFDCKTCDGNMCSGTAVSKKDGSERHLTVVFDNDGDYYNVIVSQTANSSSSGDIDETFKDEQTITEYLNNNFYNFKCF